MPHAETLQLTPPLFAFVPFFGALVTIGVCILQIMHSRKRGRKVCVGTYAWPVFSCAILIFLGIWCAMGLLDVASPGLMLATLVIAIAGSLVPLRDVMRERLEKLQKGDKRSRTLAGALFVIRDVAALLFAAEFSRLALEVPWNEMLGQLNAFHIMVEFGIIALAMGAIYFACQRYGAASLLVTIACAGFGIAQHFVIRFRHSALLPSDLLAAGTAAEVAGQFSFTLTEGDIWGLACACLSALSLSMLIPWHPKLRSTVFLWSLATNIMLALFLALSCDYWLEIPDYKYELGFDIDYWDSATSYRQQGFIPSFLVTYADMGVWEPTDYSDARAKELMAKYGAVANDTPDRAERRAASEAQFQQTKPSVVVVMNETFADLSRLGGVACNYEGPTFFKSISDACARGELGVSVNGGGTCNSEFEFLTGNTQAVTGMGKFPYELYSFDHTDDLARQFNALGYKTTAIHPMDASNWNRKKVYKEMGFDQFVSLEDFDPDTPTFHSGTTDAATYQKAIELLKSSNEPQFIFDVTIQNHSSYQQGNIPEDRLTDYEPEGVSEADAAELNEYLSCIQASDQDLAWFLEQLRGVGRPVMVVFFGDHHPAISDLYNDMLFVGDPEIEHRERVYQTDYVIWANYQVEGADQTSPVVNSSTDLLGSTMLDMVGAPLSEFQLAQQGMRTYFSAINGFGYRDTQGAWHEHGTCPELDPIFDDMKVMSYYHYKENLT